MSWLLFCSAIAAIIVVVVAAVLFYRSRYGSQRFPLPGTLDLQIFNRVTLLDGTFEMRDQNQALDCSNKDMREPPDSDDYYARDDNGGFAVIYGMDSDMEHSMVFCIPPSMVPKIFQSNQETLPVETHVSYYSEGKVFECPPAFKGVSADKFSHVQGYIYQLCENKDSKAEEYVLERWRFCDYLHDILIRCRDMWYVGTTSLTPRGLDVQALIIYEEYMEKYILTTTDCTTYAKEFTRRIVDYRGTAFDNFLEKRTVNDGKIMVKSGSASKASTSKEKVSGENMSQVLSGVSDNVAGSVRKRTGSNPGKARDPSE